MKQFMNKIVAVMIILTMVLAGTTTAFASDSNSNGINVQLNGKTLALKDTAKNVNGRVMLPFREVLEAIGATVTYDPATKKITAKTADREVSFSAGNADVSILMDGTSQSLKMDVAPYIDKGASRTFIPVRFVAESLGYSVGWDSASKTVVMIDPNTLFGKADEDFSILKKLMITDLDMEKAYATTGTFNMNVSTPATAGSLFSGLNFGIAGTMEGVQQKSSADMTMNLAFNYDAMLSKLSAEEKAQMQPMLDMFKNAVMKIKMNGETGETYMNSTLFSTMDPTVTANTWYKMNVFDTYKNMGVDLKSLYGMNYNDIKLSEILSSSLSSSNLMTDKTYEDAKIMYDFMKNLIGDEAFTTKAEGTMTTYSLKLDQKAVLAAVAKSALSAGVSESSFDVTDTAELLKTLKLDSNIVIKERSGKLYNYDINGTMTVEKYNIGLDMSGDSLNVLFNMTFDQPDMMSMTMKMESHVKESATGPNLKLPADAVVKDYPMPALTY